jgi:hypothetical protein
MDTPKGTITENSILTINSTNMVSHPTFITISQNGKVLGTVSATFDFVDMPPAFHSLVLQTLRGTNICLPYYDIPKKKENFAQRVSWYKKLLG